MKLSILFFFILSTLFSCQKANESQNAFKTVEKASLVKKYTDSHKFMGEAYCYFIYQDVISPTEITPELFSQFIKGATLSLSYLDEYNEWLKGKKGTLCKSLLGKHFRSIDKISLKKYIIFMNIKAIKDEGKNPEVTYNHERLHVAFSLYKEKRNKIQKLWDSLLEVDRNKFIQSHPGYNFTNLDIQLREYYAYKFQDNYEDGLKFLAE